jgi:hypothetical protein
VCTIPHVTASERDPRQLPESELVQVVTVEVDGFQRWLKKNPMPEQQYHTWRSLNGKYAVDAQLVSVKNDEITLRKRDGRELTVSRWKLSDQTNLMLERKAIPEVTAYQRAIKSWQRVANSQRLRVQYTL